MTSKSLAPERHSIISPDAGFRLRPSLQSAFEQPPGSSSQPPAPAPIESGAWEPPGSPLPGGTPRQEEEEIIPVTLVLRRQKAIPDPKALASHAPSARSHLGTDELKAFAASKEDIDAVLAFIVGAGMEIVQVFPVAAMIVASGTPKVVAKAFLARADGHVSASVPAELADVVRWIFGLDDRVTSRSEFHVQEGQLPPEVSRNSKLKQLLVPKGHLASEVARFYDYPELDGAGQCVGLLQLGGAASAKDLNEYFDALRINPHPTVVYVGKFNPSMGQFNLEVTFDISLVGAVCPRARIVVYNSNDVSVNGMLVALCMAIFDEVNKPSVLSMSWSFPEIDGDGPTKQEAAIFDEVLTLAAWKGITVCMSSGDKGALTPMIDGRKRANVVPVANFPSSSSYVLACGGTSLEVKDGAIKRESVWNALVQPMLALDKPGGKVANPLPMATGGGISRVYALPGYQEEAGVPPRVDCYWYLGKIDRVEVFEGRGTPDVAASADWLTGYRFVFFDGWNTVGGTSASAPMWAALVALINQGLEANHGQGTRVGWLNPLLYQLRLGQHADVCRPISSGNNGGFQADPQSSWNPCTGLGSPNGKKLAQALGAWPVKAVRRGHHSSEVLAG